MMTLVPRPLDKTRPLSLAKQTGRGRYKSHRPRPVTVPFERNRFRPKGIDRQNLRRTEPRTKPGNPIGPATGFQKPGSRPVTTTEAGSIAISPI